MTLRLRADGWVAVGFGLPHLAGEGRRPEDRPVDVHAALRVLVADGPRPVLVAPEDLLPRPRAALRALKRGAHPNPVVVWAPHEDVDERVEKAISSIGACTAKTTAAALAKLAGSAPPPSTKAASPKPSSDSKAPPLDVEFADGCLKRLDRADALGRYVLSTLARTARARRASLMVFDSSRTALVLEEAKGLDPALIGRLRTSVVGGIAGRVASLGRALTGYAGRGGPREYAGSAYVVLPLGKGATSEGVVCLTDLDPDEPPDSGSLRRLVRMARRAGRALSAARRLEQAEALSATDELTSLPNRRAFERALHREIERTRRGGATIAVGLLDIDHFKSVNDRFGHPVGDRVLVQVARRLATAFRETDLVCRWGGEEFAVLLTGLAEGSPVEALSVLERARMAVGARPLALGPGLPCPMVSVSGGVAVFPTDASDPASLLRRADEALYEAKRAGRDRVLHA